MTNPKALGSARERHVVNVLQKKGWIAQRMPGSQWGRKGAHVKPVDVKAEKPPTITIAAIKRFLNQHKSLIDIELLKAYETWREEFLNRNSRRLYIQVSKDSRGVTREEISELIFLAKRDHAFAVHAYSGKRGLKYKWINCSTGEEIRI